MKKMVFILFVIATVSQTAYSQFQTLWVKKLNNGISTVNFSHDSKLIMAWTSPNIMIFDAASGTLVNEKIPASAGRPIFSKDDSHILGINGNRIVYYNLTTENDDSYFEPTDSILQMITLSRDYKYILGTYLTGIKVWDYNTGKLIKDKQFFQNYDHTSIDSTAFSGYCEQIDLTCDQKILLKNSSTLSKFLYVDAKNKPFYDYKYQKSLKVYDFNTLDSIGCLYYTSKFISNPTEGDFFSKFILSNQCQMIALNFQSKQNGLIIYDLKTMNEISKINFDGISKTSIKFSSDDKLIVTATSVYDDKLSIWDITNGNLLNQEEGTSWETLDVSNNMQYIAGSVSSTLIMKKFQTTDIIDNQNSGNILLSPNPVTDFLELKISVRAIHELPLQNQIEIFSALGTKVCHSSDDLKSSDDYYRIDVSSLPPGVYFVRVGEKVHKFVKI